MFKSMILFNSKSLLSFAVAFLQKEHSQLKDDLVEGNLFSFVQQVKMGKVPVNAGDTLKIVSPMRKTDRVQEQYQYLQSKGVTVQDISTEETLEIGVSGKCSCIWVLLQMYYQRYSNLFNNPLYSHDILKRFADLETMNQILQVFGYRVLVKALSPSFELSMYLEGAMYQYSQIVQGKYPLRYFKEKTTGQRAVLLDEKYPYASLGELVKNSTDGHPDIIMTPTVSYKNILIFVSYLDTLTKIKADALPEGVQYIVRKGNNDYMVLPDVTVPEVVTTILD
ncbi:hypothetical protein HWC09_gp072 [Lactobacillus phage 3-521]|uniref:Uncharacterized protein n=1 Tax=Lactobacillus phage 3-521 TaxID=2510943 RepID=A0A4Y5FGM3_9CAUD|nr:hypothetical protein HWC09_gp072 [Lactobacillus phage 3-521]QBJ03647.1 hypothetical protein UCC3521_0109 [Lactobacillus phage 3-521]